MQKRIKQMTVILISLQISVYKYVEYLRCSDCIFHATLGRYESRYGMEIRFLFYLFIYWHNLSTQCPKVSKIMYFNLAMFKMERELIVIRSLTFSNFAELKNQFFLIIIFSYFVSHCWAKVGTIAP